MCVYAYAYSVTPYTASAIPYEKLRLFNCLFAPFSVFLLILQRYSTLVSFMPRIHIRSTIVVATHYACEQNFYKCMNMHQFSPKGAIISPSKYRSSALHKLWRATLLLSSTTVTPHISHIKYVMCVCVCLSRTVLTFDFSKVFTRKFCVVLMREAAGSKWSK